jgi:hypothetical protein
MDEVKRLRERIAGVKVNASGRRDYGKQLRGDLVAYTRSVVGAGGSITQTGKRLGLNPATLVNWLRDEMAKFATPMRPVEPLEGERITVEPIARRAEKEPLALVLELGGGVRVALELEQVVELVRRLRCSAD